MSSDKSKKTHIISVNSENAAWQSSTQELSDDVNDPIVNDAEKFNTGLLDYMNVDEFVHLMKNKTENNYDALWDASKALANQLKASKSLLSLNGYMCMGRTKNEIMEKLIDSMKFTLKADHVYVYEYLNHDNVLVVTHSDVVGSIHQKIPVCATDGGIEGKN